MIVVKSGVLPVSVLSFFETQTAQTAKQYLVKSDGLNHVFDK